MNINKSEQIKLSRSKRILLGFVGIALALTLFVIFFIEALLFIGTPFLLDCFASLSLVVLGLILPYFAYKHSSTPFKIIVLWFLLMAAIVPILTQPYYKAVAARLVLQNDSDKVVNVKYTPYTGIKEGATYITYSYQTENQEQDYETMKGLYIAKFSSKKWIILEQSDGDKSYVSFSKTRNFLPRVTLVIDKKTPGLIEVGVSF